MFSVRENNKFSAHTSLQLIINIISDYLTVHILEQYQ
jgi:hypothetical protein